MSCVPWTLPQASFDVVSCNITAKEMKDTQKKMIERHLRDHKMKLDIFECEIASLRKVLPRNQINICKEIIDTCALKGQMMIFIGDAPGYYASILLKNDTTTKWLAVNAKTDPLYFKVLRNHENGMQWYQNDKFCDEVKLFHEKADLVISNTCYNPSICTDLECDIMKSIKNEILFVLKMQKIQGNYLFGFSKPESYSEFRILYLICCLYEYVSILTPKSTESTELYVFAQSRKDMCKNVMKELNNVLENDIDIEMPDLWISETLTALDQILFARMQS